MQLLRLVRKSLATSDATQEEDRAMIDDISICLSTKLLLSRGNGIPKNIT